MKKILIVMLVMFSALFVQAKIYKLHVDEDVLLLALEQVENAKGDPNLVGDIHLKNKAYGLLQIRQPYLDDVNRIAGADVQKVWGKDKLTTEDMKDKGKARWTARVYLSHYGRHYEKVTGLNPTVEIYARIHNGGPNGWRKGVTDRYWERVKKVL